MTGMNRTINFVENKIKHGITEFVLDMDFGTIVVEVNYKDYSPANRVIITDWDVAKNTNYNMVNYNAKADYHVVIANVDSDFALHMRVVDMWYRLMFKKMGYDVSEAIIDAAIMIHFAHYDGKCITINSLYHNIMKKKIGFMARQDDMVQFLVREYITNRINAANKIISDAGNAFDEKFNAKEDIEIITHRGDAYTRLINGLRLIVKK